MANILVVDDNADHLAFVKVFLAHDHTVDTAVNADEALERLRRGGIDAVVLDLMLPGISGIDLALKLKDESAVFGVPIVIWTARELNGGLERLLQQAVNIHSVLPKPCQLSVLAQTIDRMVGSCRQAAVSATTS